MSDNAAHDNIYDIAIVGMSGRFPGASNIAEFWQNLRDGVESISFFSDEELLAAGVDRETLNEPGYVKAGGSLAGVDLFDASFFGFNPREAEILDPQQRVFLECAWESLEQAGYDPEKFPGSIGVYAGTSMSSYLYNVYSNPDLVGLVGDFQVQLGNDKDNLPTSVSYKLNLKGPSIAIQTACSTSLVAVCVASQSLLSYECDMALAGGVRIALPQTSGYAYQEGGIMSPDGHCRAFDARAQGTIGGNGVGIVVLRRLSDALADGDFIHAVIKGTAVNNDGSLKVGYTAPSIEGQAEVITMAQAAGSVEPRTVTYIEAHGTGTDLGDPIEIAALTQAFHAGTDATSFCAIGSVKTNIGHLDTAAGVAGLIKTVLALEHKTIPPSLNFQQPNPRIDFASSPFYVSDRLSKWEANGAPRRAGVNSFGIGGTNAHVIVEEAPVLDSPPSFRPEHLLVISARTSAALETATTNLVEHFKQHPDLNIADAAYTLHVGRRSFDHRRMLVCGDTADAITALEQRDAARTLSSKVERTAQPLTFMFSGQGTQYVDMGLGLYQHEPGFREQIDHCSEILEPHLGFDLRNVLFPPVDRAEESAQRLLQTSLAQPALFTIEYGIARLLMQWGIRPSSMIGHSLGEYVAACLAGVFSLDDALALVAARGRLMQEMPSGAMLAVPLPEPDVRSYLNGRLSLAAVNGPSLCVVSGPTDAVRELELELSSKGFPGRLLHTSHAFHSDMMEPMLASFRERVASVELQPPGMPYISNLTGTWITPEEATDPQYWAKHVRGTVRFGEGLGQLLANDGILLEIGPGQTLCTLAKQQNGNSASHTVISTLRPPHDRQGDDRFLLNALGRLWLSGVNIDWAGYHRHEKRRRTPLPTYPFERQLYWVDAQPDIASAHSTPALTLEKRFDIGEWFYIPSWKRSGPPDLLPQPAEPEKRWLLFIDSCGVGRSLADRLKSAGKDVVVVEAGEQFARPGENAYVINPCVRADYDSLLKDLRALDQIPEVLVHLWSVTREDRSASELESYESFQRSGFDSLLNLAQAFGDHGGTSQIRLSVVSNQMQSVTGDEVLTPSKATVLGPCKVIPEEYPHITCRSIDIESTSGDPHVSTITAQLFDELTALSLDEVVAYRGEHRWVQTFDAIRLGEDEARAPIFKDDGVYLVTGGLGGIGLTIAEHLAKTVRARLVLLGRREFPANDSWAEWQESHDAGDPISITIRKLRSMEEAGAQVMVVSCDVADITGMRQVAKLVNERFGKISGVIHSAGVAGGRMIQLQTPEDASRVLSPKAQGTLVLDAVLKDQELDLFVLCSSLNALQGALGQVDYCAANTFLDAFAHAAGSRKGTKVVSINWDTWQEVGMAVNTVVPRDMEEMRAESLKHGITSSEGIEAFKRILRTRLQQVAVSTISLQALMARDTNENAGNEQEEAVQSTESKQVYARPALVAEYVAPRDDVELNLASTWQNLLGVEQIGIHDNFFELGGHSLLAVQIVSRLREKFHIELSIGDFFNSPTIAELARTINNTHETKHGEIDQISRMLKLVEELSENEIEEMLARSDLSVGEDDK